MVNKSLLLGFGLGLVFSAGYLLVTPVAGGNTDTLTEVQLKQAAEAQNLVVLPKAEYQNLLKKQAPPVTTPASPKKPGASVPPATSKAPVVSTPTSPTTHTPVKEERKTVSPPSTTSPVSPEKAEATIPPATSKQPVVSTPTSPTTPSPVKTVTFRVEAGTNAARVAQNLVKSELLPPSNQFIRLLKEKNMLNRIRSGSFQIPKGAKEEEIITILTTPPKR